MSFFNSPEPELDEPVASQTSSSRSPFADVAGRFAHWLAGLDREQAEAGLDPATRMGPLAELDPSVSDTDAPGAPGPDEPAPRFPVSPLGYNRATVDEHLAALEHELAQLREQRPAPRMSVTEELEMIGQQTASILVVAHDKAHETTRRAQEQADHVIAEASAAAAAVTDEARQRLREIDSETDAVWRERERLLDDVRVVSKALTDLADEAADRFPAAETGVMGASSGQAAAEWTPMRAGAPAPAGDVPASSPAPQDTMPFSVVEAEGWQDDSPRTGDWLAGLEPGGESSPQAPPEF